jgi:hypothetical protein
MFGQQQPSFGGELWRASRQQARSSSKQTPPRSHLKKLSPTAAVGFGQAQSQPAFGASPASSPFGSTSAFGAQVADRQQQHLPPRQLHSVCQERMMPLNHMSTCAYNDHGISPFPAPACSRPPLARPLAALECLGRLRRCVCCGTNTAAAAAVVVETDQHPA